MYNNNKPISFFFYFIFFSGNVLVSSCLGSHRHTQTYQNRQIKEGLHDMRVSRMEFARDTERHQRA